MSKCLDAKSEPTIQAHHLSDEYTQFDGLLWSVLLLAFSGWVAGFVSDESAGSKISSPNKGASVPFRRHSNFLYQSVIFLSTFLSQAVLLRAEGFQPVSPEELNMTGEPLAPGAPAVILYREVDREDVNISASTSYASGNGTVGAGHAYTIREVGSGHENDYYRVKILTDEGRKYGDVEIPFETGRGLDLTNVHGRTIHPDGFIVNFDGKIVDREIHKAKGVRYKA